MDTVTTDIDRIQALGDARNQALLALADIDRDLRRECLAAVRFGCAAILVAQFAGIARCKLDMWIDEERQMNDEHRASHA